MKFWSGADQMTDYHLPDIFAVKVGPDQPNSYKLYRAVYDQLAQTYDISKFEEIDNNTLSSTLESSRADSSTTAPEYECRVRKEGRAYINTIMICDVYKYFILLYSGIPLTIKVLNIIPLQYLPKNNKIYSIWAEQPPQPIHEFNSHRQVHSHTSSRHHRPHPATPATPATSVATGLAATTIGYVSPLDRLLENVAIMRSRLPPPSAPPVEIGQFVSTSRLGGEPENYSFSQSLRGNNVEIQSSNPIISTRRASIDVVSQQSQSNKKLPAHAIHLIKAGSEAKKESCPIHMTPIDVNNSLVTPCAHVFSKDGLTKWFINPNNKVCPVCRASCLLADCG